MCHRKSNKFKVSDLDEVLGVDLAEVELIRAVLTLLCPNIQDLLCIAVPNILLPEADVNLFALIFEDEGDARRLHPDDRPLHGFIVEFFTELLKADLLASVQVADYGVHGAT